MLKPPSVPMLLNSLLIVLARTTKNKANVFVNHNSILDAIIKETGYNPENLASYGEPALGWQKTGRHRVDSNCFYRKIIRAFQLGHFRKEVPLVVRGAKKGQWGLTEAGLQVALISKGTPIDSNITSRYLETRLRDTGGVNGKFWRVLQNVVAYKLPVSATSSMIDDHIHNCIVKLVHRDALKKDILAGKRISDRQIAVYAVRSAYNDCRDSATDPVSRELYKARTEKERRLGENALTYASDFSLTPKTVNKDGKESPADIYDSSDHRLEDRIAFNAIWTKIEKLVQTKKPKSYKKYMRVMDMHIQGHDFKTIHKCEKLTVPKARQIVKDVKSYIAESGLEV